MISSPDGGFVLVVDVPPTLRFEPSITVLGEQWDSGDEHNKVCDFHNSLIL